MRVAIFSTDDFIPPAGGAEIAIGEITKRLPHIEFDLWTARLRKECPPFEKKDNVTIYRLGIGNPNLDKILLATLGHHYVMAMHKKKKYHLLWSMMASYGAFSALRCKKKLNLPYLLTLQEGDPLDVLENKMRWFKKSFQNLFVLADGLQPISHYLYEWGKRMGFGGEYGQVIPNGVDIEHFSYPHPAADKQELRKSWGFAQNATILITVSRLEEKNGVGDIIKALSLLPKEVCLVIAGFGSLEKNLQSQVLKLGLEERVKFVGLITHVRLPLYLQSSDIFIRPSLTEGLGNAFLEAMASSTPVIATLVGGIPDFLFDGVTGFACEPKNSFTIARAVERIMGLDTIALDKVRQKALQLVQDQFNWNSVAKRMEQLFQAMTQKI